MDLLNRKCKLSVEFTDETNWSSRKGEILAFPTNSSHSRWLHHQQLSTNCANNEVPTTNIAVVVKMVISNNGCKAGNNRRICSCTGNTSNGWTYNALYLYSTPPLSSNQACREHPNYRCIDIILRIVMHTNLSYKNQSKTANSTYFDINRAPGYTPGYKENR